MRLLQVVASLDPAGGGPAECIRQSGVQLLARGHAMEVLTLDAPTAPFVAAAAFPVHALGPSVGGYQYNGRLVDWLRHRAAGYDAVVVNGLWQYHAFGTWRALRGSAVPYLVYPHGMLDPWFRRTYPLKHLKKSLYWPWADYRLLRDARAVLLTCEEERLLARQSFRRYRAREAVVAFGTGRPPSETPSMQAAFFARFPSLRGKRILLFLGRLQEKKGCDLLVEAWARSCRDAPEAALVMAGPDANGWQAELEASAERLGVADRITWTGMLEGDIKWGAFHACDAFVLPSHQENFGIAVAEAMACGKPVVISDKVNIWREVEAAGAGWVGDDTVDGTASSLSRWLAADQAERRSMGTRASGLFAERFTAEAMVESLLAIIRARATAGPVAVPA